MSRGTVPGKRQTAMRLRLRHTEAWLLLLILLLASWLRFYHLTASSLWSDEGNTWALLGRSFAQIAHDAAADIHPPGYYWLLKIWSWGFGTSAAGMRSFSAVCGIALVWVIYQNGRALGQGQQTWPSMALLAALSAALNPFQIYYSQEARMYMLLALESAGLFCALWALLPTSQAASASVRNARQSKWGPALVYLLCGSAGLWTHYSFPIVLAAAGLAYLASLARRERRALSDTQLVGNHQSPIANLFIFIGLNLLILLAFAPWLPVAIDRVRHWPKGGETSTLLQGLAMTVQMLIFGPLHKLPAWPGLWLWVAGILPLLGLVAPRRQPGVWALALWLLAPLALMFGLGLFSDAFLKFLLVASPAWCLACATAPQGLGLFAPSYASRYIQYALACLACLFFITLALLVLPAYYTDAVARDNYAGVAHYVRALGNPATDLVLLDAPGQQEVWRYYDPGLPILALPQQRPPDPAQTVATLAAATKTRTNIYALFWALDEADPAHTVEHWLDQHAFKGLDRWQNNLRFVTYRLPNQLTCQALPPHTLFGESILLVEQCQAQFPQRVVAGEVALIGLHWQARAPIQQRYKVSVQLLDARNQVIAQQDSEPAGNAQPTNSWQPKTTVMDNHGLVIPFGTPPGAYRLIARLYDQANNQRLLVGAADAVELGQIQVLRPQRPIPVDIIPMLYPLNRLFKDIRLLGYDAYRKDYGYAPATPIRPGDLVHFTFYWQAPDPLPTTTPETTFRLQLGEQMLEEPFVPNVPRAHWQAGEILRGEFDLAFDGTAQVPILTIGQQRYTLSPLPR